MLEAFIKRFRDPEPAPVNEPQANPSSAPTKVTYPDPEMAGIPNSARPKISRINDLIKDIKTRIDQDILSKPVIIEMEQMRDRHVPKLLQSYVEIPPEHRREIFNQTGRSASVHLTESLDAIISRLEEIDKSLAKENLNTFADNAKFISQTYGSKSDPLG